MIPWNKQIYLCDWQQSSEPVWFILKEYVWGDAVVHLWFLKRLMLFFVFSPVFIFLIKRFSLGVLVIAVCLVFVIDSPNLSLQTTYFNDDLLCFISGMSLSCLRFDMRKKCPWYIGCILFIIWILFCIFPMPGFRFIYLRNLVGLAAIWTFFDMIYPLVKISSKFLLECASFSFLIYCFHMIPLSLASIILTPRIPNVLFRYFVIWFISVGGSIIFVWCLKKLFSRAYKILSGGR